MSLALLISLALLASVGAGDAYLWEVHDPAGLVYDGAGQEWQFKPWEPGLHSVKVTVLYRHESAPGVLYVATATSSFPALDNPNLIFGDGFDSRTPLARWSTTGGV